ncbi:MAG: hypothetical protein AAF806_12965, partial [Bacteroidota bacterium]
MGKIIKKFLITIQRITFKTECKCSFEPLLRDIEKYNLRIELVIYHYLRVKNFDRSPAMLKIFALIKQKITNLNLR